VCPGQVSVEPAPPGAGVPSGVVAPPATTVGCSGHGRCDEVHGGCLCYPGFAGEDCSQLACPRDCSGPSRGFCAAGGQCVCYAGWTGEACSMRACPSACHGRGYCQPGGICACTPPWTGPDCSKRLCVSGEASCHGRGVCQGGACYCEAGWMGDSCETRVQPTSRGRGRLLVLSALLPGGGGDGATAGRASERSTA
jgi:tenascin